MPSDPKPDPNPTGLGLCPECGTPLDAGCAHFTPWRPVVLDVDVLAAAICWTREPPVPAGVDPFVCDECRSRAREIAAKYEALRDAV